MTNKKISENEKKEILGLAETLYGKERLKAYKLVDEPKLELDYANELLIAKDDNYGRGPCAFEPYKAKDWKVLRIKNIFDEERFFYDGNAVREGLMNTHIDVYDDRPSKEHIKTIDNILTCHDIDEEKRRSFFVKLRERAKEKVGCDETSIFVFGLKETAYSALASHTSVPRKQIVDHYLDHLFKEKDINHLLYIDNLSTKLLSFMQKENIDEEEIVSRTIKAVRDYKPGFFSGKDKKLDSYYFINEMSKIPTLKFPKDFVIKILKDYVKAGGELWERHCKESPAILSFHDVLNDPEVRKLREKSLRQEIESKPVCLVERVNYGIREFNLNPKEGWLRKSLENTINEWSKRNEKFELSATIYIGRTYELLSREEIEKLERKLELVKQLKS